jgi:hypothetical protein
MCGWLTHFSSQVVPLGQSNGAKAANPDAQGGHDGPPPLLLPTAAPESGMSHCFVMFPVGAPAAPRSRSR